jgi:hypothetical protein
MQMTGLRKEHELALGGIWQQMLPAVAGSCTGATHVICQKKARRPTALSMRGTGPDEAAHILRASPAVCAPHDRIRR